MKDKMNGMGEDTGRCLLGGVYVVVVCVKGVIVRRYPNKNGQVANQSAY